MLHNRKSPGKSGQPNLRSSLFGFPRGIFSEKAALLINLLQFEHQCDGRGAAAASCRHGDGNAALTWNKGYILAAVQHSHLGDLAGVRNKQLGINRFLGDGEQPDSVNRIALPGKGNIPGLIRGADTGAINRFAVNLKPFAQAPQAVHGVHRDAAVRLGTDVQCQVSAFCNDAHQRVHQLPGGICTDRRIHR